MGDLASDHDAAIRLIIEEYHRLEKHNPKHELLKYITDVKGDGFTHVNYEKFLERFETEEDKKESNIKVVKVLATYYIALRDAVDKIEGIDRSPKKPENNKKPIKTLEESFDDLPF